MCGSTGRCFAALLVGGVLALGSSATGIGGLWGGNVPTTASAEFQVVKPGKTPTGVKSGDWSEMTRHIHESEYRVSRGAAGAKGRWQAPNRANNLRTFFDPDGIRVQPRVVESSSGTAGAASGERAGTTEEAPWEAGLRLVGWGARGAALKPVAAVEPVTNGQRVEYVRDGLTEWYVNRVEGLEHGFTLEEPEFETSGGVQLNLALTGGFGVATAEDGLSATFRNGETELRYAGLRVVDADGRELRARMEVVRGRDQGSKAPSEPTLSIMFEAAGVSWPVTVDPLLTQVSKLTSLGLAFDSFGYSVAISGNTAVVGAFLGDVGGTANQGYASVFVRTGGVWSEQQTLVASDGGLINQFGISVSISGDTLVVGANQKAAAYVFVRSGVTWTQQQKLVASDGVSGHFGISVAISGDTVVVGADQDDALRGSAYVFVRSGATWTQQQKLLAPDSATFDRFGSSVSISGDTAVVGAFRDDVGTNQDQGSAHVFVRSGATWTPQQMLVASDGATGDQSGISVSISGDTAVVGAFADTIGPLSQQGSAYVFVRNGVTWTQEQKLVASDGGYADQFGVSVSISGDTVAVGADRDDPTGNPTDDQGSAYTFVRSGTIWTQQQKLVAPDGTNNDLFGHAVSVFGDTVLVGAHTDAVGANTSQGSAYVFDTPIDAEAPVLTLPADIVSTNILSSGTPINFAVSATDNVDPAVTVTCVPASGSVFFFGLTAVTCSATDVAGNSAQGTFGVTVQFPGGTGTIGPQGATGATGATGADGPIGPMGPVGPMGPMGPVGPMGPMGPQGAQGPQGEIGPTGATGSTGATGAAGADGAAGLAGTPGIAGPMGPMGVAGPAGPKGDTGAVGGVGPPGPPGLPAPIGSRGGVFTLPPAPGITLPLWTREVSFAPGQGEVQGITTSGTNAIVAFDALDLPPVVTAYDAVGTIVWTRSLNAPARFIRALESDASGHIYALGANYAGDVDGDWFVTKLDPNGATVWSALLQARNAGGLTIDAAGNVFVVAGGASPNQDALVTFRIDAAGNTSGPEISDTLPDYLAGSRPFIARDKTSARQFFLYTPKSRPDEIRIAVNDAGQGVAGSQLLNEDYAELAELCSDDQATAFTVDDDNPVFACRGHILKIGYSGWEVALDDNDTLTYALVPSPSGDIIAVGSTDYVATMARISPLGRVRFESSFPGIVGARSATAAVLAGDLLIVGGIAGGVNGVTAESAFVAAWDAVAPTPSQPTLVTATATSNAGGLIAYTAAATDNRDTAVSMLCSPASGSLVPVGVHTGACRATDSAGNSTEYNFQIVVSIPTVDGTGPTGATGAMGPQGVQGPQGDPGPQGPQGAQGIQGAVGPGGADGAPGTAGAAGAIGPIGPEGLQGDPGAPGINGAAGAPGLNGAPGPAGATGPRGPGTETEFIGVVINQADETLPLPATTANVLVYTLLPDFRFQRPVLLNDPEQFLDKLVFIRNPTRFVAVDIIGPGLGTRTLAPGQSVLLTTQPLGTGVRWAVLDDGVGLPGMQGPAGAQGPQGLTGNAGPPGPTGAPGPTGPRGPSGTNGLNGLNGAIGPAGPTGPAGPAGAPGARGPIGPMGPIGAPGAPGIPRNAMGAYNLSNVFGFVSDTPQLFLSAEPPDSGPGVRFMWFAGKAAFRAGQVIRQRWNNANIGTHSVAMGLDPVASGESSLAIGSSAAARGDYSVAIGQDARADADQSMAFGANARAVGFGSMVLTDGTGRGNFVASGANQFVASFFGGMHFETGRGVGARLAPGSGSWSNLSDVRMKENFRVLDGESVLKRLAGIPVLEWNYISQDASIRHVGPMAQDFRKAFGLGENDTTISTIDPDGISLKAIQALDVRTQALQKENESLRAELAALRQAIERLTPRR